MTPHQVAVAAEAYATCLLAQAGFDVLVQYGADQPEYDLVAASKAGIAKVSVKGSSSGEWMIAVKKRHLLATYQASIESWAKAQDPTLVMFFVQFKNVCLGQAPRAYVATIEEVRKQLVYERNGMGAWLLYEDSAAHRPKSRYADKLPASWVFTRTRMEELVQTITRRRRDDQDNLAFHKRETHLCFF